jgi:hypothetical protein
MFINPFYFQFHTTQIKPKHRSYYQRHCKFTGTHFSHFYEHSKVCTSTGHKMVCWISGACQMAISKGTFCRHCKMAGNILSSSKIKEGHYYYLLHAVIFTFTMPLIATLQLVRISRFVDLPQHDRSVTCIDAH